MNASIESNESNEIINEIKPSKPPLLRSLPHLSPHNRLLHLPVSRFQHCPPCNLAHSTPYPASTLPLPLGGNILAIRGSRRLRILYNSPPRYISNTVEAKLLIPPTDPTCIFIARGLLKIFFPSQWPLTPTPTSPETPPTATTRKPTAAAV